jgi:polysaccharide pyruvyl transferase WcaK-like protein
VRTGARRPVAFGVRVGVLTLHCGGNYGAVLQAYALARAVREAGHEVEVVDYRTQTGVAHYRRERLPVNPETRRPQPLFAAHARKAWKNDRFVERHTPLSPDSFRSPTELGAYRSRYDVAVAGSDQIWDLTTERGLETCFFLDWADPATTARISYGPSVGTTTSLGPHAAVLTPLLRSFAAVSVRDDPSAAVVAAATGSPPTKVLDPTFLVDFHDVLRRPRPRRPYLALYGYVRDRRVLAEIRRVADARGLDVVSLGFRTPGARRSRVALGPDEWLGALAGADYVVTSFYHGLVFALRFGRPFTVLPKEGKAHKVNDLLGIVGLEERSRIEDDAAPIDWDRVRGVLEAETARSSDYLRGALAAGRRYGAGTPSRSAANPSPAASADRS